LAALAHKHTKLKSILILLTRSPRAPSGPGGPWNTHTIHEIRSSIKCHELDIFDVFQKTCHVHHRHALLCLHRLPEDPYHPVTTHTVKHLLLSYLLSCFCISLHLLENPGIHSLQAALVRHLFQDLPKRSPQDLKKKREPKGNLRRSWAQVFISHFVSFVPIRTSVPLRSRRSSLALKPHNTETVSERDGHKLKPWHSILEAAVLALLMYAWMLEFVYSMTVWLHLNSLTEEYVNKAASKKQGASVCLPQGLQTKGMMFIGGHSQKMETWLMANL